MQVTHFYLHISSFAASHLWNNNQEQTAKALNLKKKKKLFFFLQSDCTKHWAQIMMQMQQERETTKYCLHHQQVYVLL